MSYLGQYSEAMDYVRERLELPDATPLYECVVKFVAEFKRLDETKKEKVNVGASKGSGKRSGTSSSGGGTKGRDPWEV